MPSNNKLKNTLLERIKEIKADPNKAKATFKSETELVDGVLAKARIRQFHLTSDEPKELGGNDTAPNPVELILASLGTCQEIIYNAYANVLDIPIENVKVNVKGNLDLRGFFGLDENVKPGFEEITYDTEIISNADQETINQLVAVVEKNCPVLDTLTRAVKVNGNVKLTKSLAAA